MALFRRINVAPQSRLLTRPVLFRARRSRGAVVSVRLAEQGDLRALEWNGEYSDHRLLIEQQHRLQSEGLGLILVAALENERLGQIWVDLVKGAADGAGVLWALRVQTRWQGRGIGAALMNAAHRELAARGRQHAQLAVEKTNTRASSLYLRLGYEVVGDEREHGEYVTADGVIVRWESDVWVMRHGLCAP